MPAPGCGDPALEPRKTAPGCGDPALEPRKTEPGCGDPASGTKDERLTVGIIVLDRAGRCTTSGPAWTRLTGQAGTTPLDLGWLGAIHRDDRPAVAAVASMDHAGGEWSMTCRASAPGDRACRLELHATTLDSAATVRDRQILAAVEVTDDTDDPDPPRRAADRDALTRLPGRPALLDALEAGLQSVRMRDQTLALIVLDLDAFGEINDAFGLEAGDRLLIEIGSRLSRAVRRNDTVVRLAGDQFAAVLPDIDHAEGAFAATQRILAALEQPVVLADERVAVSASAGIALAPEGGADTPARLLRQADIALQQAKHNRLGVALYEVDAVHQPTAAHARLAELRDAIRGNQLVLHYQPCVRLVDGSVRCVEALVRWNHPQRGLLPPAEFVPFAERSGLIRELDVAVLELAARQIVRWRDSPLASVRVAVNISRASLLDDRFAAALAATLIRHGLQGPELQLEITESGLFGDPEQAIWLAERLCALGVDLSIDDFGTGYSSLAQLRDLRATTLKVDRAFVTHALDQPTDAAILETIVVLGHRFGKNVVAEGVEDASTLALLADLGVDEAQGYAISRPVPPRALEAWLAARTSGTVAGNGRVLGPIGVATATRVATTDG